MGMETRVPLAGGIPPWPRVLEEAGSPPLEMRMIDGELSFPDEMPPETWHELRVARAGIMLTIRRAENAVLLVGWGTGDPAQVALTEALVAAFQRAAGM
ncbi:MAG: hypothetical protein U0840_23595 [Gemmataceae bacterium]